VKEPLAIRIEQFLFRGEMLSENAPLIAENFAKGLVPVSFSN